MRKIYPLKQVNFLITGQLKNCFFGRRKGCPPQVARFQCKSWFWVKARTRSTYTKDCLGGRAADMRTELVCENCLKKSRNRLHRGVQRLPEQRPNGEKTDEHEMWAYSKWSCIRVQLHNWKNGYSKITGLIIYSNRSFLYPRCFCRQWRFSQEKNVKTSWRATANRFFEVCIGVPLSTASPPCYRRQFS